MIWELIGGPSESLLHSSLLWLEAKQGGLLCHFSENVLCVNLSNIVGQEEKDGNVDLKKKKKIMLFIKHVIQM